MLIKTFKATIHGVFPMTTELPMPDSLITFTKNRILLSEPQIGHLYFDPFQVQQVTDRMEYSFDKLNNSADEKMFSIILKIKLNNLDTGIYHLDISRWNKIKANIIHHRYWIDREKEWFLKTVIATTIGAIMALMGAYVGYRIGLQSLKLPTTTVQPNTHQQSKP